LLAISFTIAIIQLYKQARMSHIINGPFHDDEIMDHKSDNTQNLKNNKKTMNSH
jgi:hypothetical protein